MSIPLSMKLALAVAVFIFIIQTRLQTNELDIVSLTYGKVKSVRISISDGVPLPQPLIAFFAIPCE